MSNQTKADDWGVATAASLSAAGGAAAGVWIFGFNSPSAGVTFPALFSGFGMGVGAKAANIGGLAKALPALLSRIRIKASLLEGLPFSKLKCNTPFSARDMDIALGRLTTARVGAGPVAFGPTFISAGPFNLISIYTATVFWPGSYFASQGSIPGSFSAQPLLGRGISGAAEAQAAVLLGLWGRLSLDT